VKTANAHALTPAWRHADRAVVRRDEAALTELVGGVSAQRRRIVAVAIFACSTPTA